MGTFFPFVSSVTSLADPISRQVGRRLNAWTADGRTNHRKQAVPSKTISQGVCVLTLRTSEPEELQHHLCISVPLSKRNLTFQGHFFSHLIEGSSKFTIQPLKQTESEKDLDAICAM